MEESSGPSFRSSPSTSTGRAGVDEVELVLEVVVVQEPFEPGGMTIALTPNAVTPSAPTLRKP